MAIMEIVVRPPSHEEVVDYLRALPFANGLPSWEPWPAAWHGGAEAWPRPTLRTHEQLEQLVDGVLAAGIHPQAAFDDDRCVENADLHRFGHFRCGPLRLRSAEADCTCTNTSPGLGWGLHRSSTEWKRVGLPSKHTNLTLSDRPQA